MTRYEQGFLTKCAEHGFDAGTSMALMGKIARETRDHGEGALLGAKIGLGTGGAFGGSIGTAALLSNVDPHRGRFNGGTPLGGLKAIRKMKLKGKLAALAEVLAGGVLGGAMFGAPAAAAGAAMGGLIGRKNKD